MKLAPSNRKVPTVILASAMVLGSIGWAAPAHAEPAPWWAGECSDWQRVVADGFCDYIDRVRARNDWV